MPRIQVYLPDDLHRQLKRQKLSPSELLQAAVRAEVERAEKNAELKRYLAELEEEVGPPSASDKAWARNVANRLRRHRRAGETTRRAG